MKIILTKKEKKVVIKITQAQLKGLRSMRDSEGVDLKMHCIKRELPEDEVISLINRDIKLYKKLLFHPDQFINLPDSELSIFTHILVNYKPKNPKSNKARNSIFRKINLANKMQWFHKN